MKTDWRSEPLKYRGIYWDYYQDRFIGVGGTRTRYWSEGGGETVVLIHGFGGSVEEWAWNVPALAERHRVISLDLPGFGLTDKPDADYGYEYFAAFVDRFMETVGVARAHVIGHSMGGAIALNLALRHPARVRSLTLIAPAFGRRYPFAMHALAVPLLGESLLRPPSSPEEVAAGFRALTYEPIMYADLTLDRYLRFRREPGYARASLKYMRNYLTAFGLSRRGKRLERFYRDAIPRLELPVFLAWGPQDAVVPFGASRDLLALLPRAEFWSPDPCGHCPHFEYPEEFNERALAFLSRS